MQSFICSLVKIWSNSWATRPSSSIFSSASITASSHEVFVKLSKPHFFHFFLHGAGHEIQISYSCQGCILNMCWLSYIYGRHSLQLEEDRELLCVVQDFCLVTVAIDIFNINFDFFRKKYTFLSRPNCFKQLAEHSARYCPVCFLYNLIFWNLAYLARQKEMIPYKINSSFAWWITPSLHQTTTIPR